jgi:hypothetical protein
MYCTFATRETLKHPDAAREKKIRRRRSGLNQSAYQLLFHITYSLWHIQTRVYLDKITMRGAYAQVHTRVHVHSVACELVYEARNCYLTITAVVISWLWDAYDLVVCEWVT